MDRKIGLVLLAAGSGKRMKTDENKVLLNLDGNPIIWHTLKAFVKSGVISQYVLVCKKSEEHTIKEITSKFHIDVTLAHGGKERQDSVYSGLLALNDDIKYVMVHDSARPYISPSTIKSCAKELEIYGSAVVGVYSHDTIKKVENGKIIKTLNRLTLVNIQTPQCFEKNALIKAHQKAQEDDFLGTDESILLERLGHSIRFVEGKYSNIKITTKEDMENKENRLMRIGHGMDIHAFSKDRNLIIGGVKIPHHQGLLGHSDADVLIHAIMDSLLGAAGFNDIGHQFPDTDSEFKNIDSKILLKKTNDLINEKGFLIENIDCTLVLQSPKVNEYLSSMKDNIADCLNIDKDRINIKATTTENLGYVGRQEGVAAHAVCLLYLK